MKVKPIKRVDKILILDKPLRAGRWHIKVESVVCPASIATTIYKLNPRKR